MSKIFRRIFRRDRPPQSDLTTDQYDKRQTSNRNRKLPDKSDEDDDDISNDVENQKDDRPSRQTELRRQARGAMPLDEDRPSNPRNIQLRSVSNGVQSGLPNNTNLVPTPNLTTQTGVPSQSQVVNPSSRSPSNPLPQTSTPSANRVPQLPSRRNLALLMNRPRPPIKISPNSTLIGFPLDPNEPLHIPSSLPNRPFFPHRQNRTLSSYQPRDNISTFEYDYPIKHILIDGNIPSSITNKINKAVEYDSFGTQPYPYNPQSQRNARRLTGNSRQYGIRHIREIHDQNSYPQQQINNTPQVNCSFQYHLNSFPMPIHHFTASALPNDPMRCY